MIRDFERKDPMRAEINADTVVTEDLVDAFKAMNDDLRRFSMTAESRFATFAFKKTREFARLCELMARGIRNEQLRTNKEYKTRV